MYIVARLALILSSFQSTKDETTLPFCYFEAWYRWVEHELQVFEIEVLKNIFGHTENEVCG
jgi:hypothetical protein